jgi:hypothetical protein
MDELDWKATVPDLSGQIMSVNYQHPFGGGYSTVYQGQWSGKTVRSSFGLDDYIR